VPAVRFDTRANWALVRALLTEPTAEVQFIFIHRALGALLIEEAAREGEPAELVDRAEAVFQSPGHVDPHDDHMHVRVYCDPGDRFYGCVDHGPQRWWKKRWKYMPPADAERAAEPVAAATN
jgi:penicillin-insensitive murein endopeptidase